jgi:hypothetical protein
MSEDEKEMSIVPKDDTDTSFAVYKIYNGQIVVELPRGVIFPIKYINLDNFYIFKDDKEINKEQLKNLLVSHK